MTGLHYPDNLYADALAKAELSPTERKLRTALAYVNHARDLIRDALGDNEPKAQREAKIAYDVAAEQRSTERVPKWDVRWGIPHTQNLGYSQGSCTGVSAPIPQNQAPNCDGLSARDIRSPHPMSAEAIRDHDERLAGGEDRL